MSTFFYRLTKQLTFILISCFTSSVYGGVQSTQVDSLNGIIESSGENDTLKGKAYLELMMILSKTNFDTIVPLCKNVIEMIQEGLSEPISESERIALLKIKAESLHNIGYYYSERKQLRTSLMYYLQSFKVSRKIRDFLTIAMGLNNVAFLYRDNGKMNKALTCYLKSLRLLQQVGGKEEQRFVLDNIGSYYRIQGRFEEALRYYARSLEMSKETKVIKTILRTLNFMASTYFNKGEMNMARIHLKMSLKFLEKTDDKQQLANTLDGMGLLHYKQGNIVEALEYFMRSIKICDEINDRRGLAISYNNIGCIYREEQNFKKAERYYRKTLSHYLDLNDPVSAAGTYVNLGVLYGLMEEYNKSLVFYNKAVSVYKNLNRVPRLIITLNSLGETYMKKGNVNKAINLFEEGLILGKRIKYKEGMATSYIGLGEAYLNKGANADAISYSLKGLELAKALELPRKIQEVSESLSRLYEKENRKNEALKMYKLYTRVKSKLQHEEAQKAMVKLESENVIKGKDKEIEVLKKEKDIREHKFWLLVIIYGILLFFLLMTVLYWNRVKTKRFKKELNTLRKLKSETTQDKNKTKPQSIIITRGKSLVPIDLSEVLYFNSESGFVFLHLKEGTSHVADDTIKNLETSLPSFFVRVHRSYIINVEEIHRIEKTYNGKVNFTLKGKEEITVPSGKVYAEKVKQIMEELDYRGMSR